MKINKNMGKIIDVIVELDNGSEFTGKINIEDFDRFSDFIEDHDKNNIKLFDAKKKAGSISGGLKKFLIIPKSKICFYEPFDSKKRGV